MDKLPLVGSAIADWWRANMVSEGSVTDRFAMSTQRPWRG